MALYRILLLLSLIIINSVSFSPHDDLIGSTVKSSECENIHKAFRVMFLKIDHYLAACVSAPKSISSVKERETVRMIGYCGLLSSLSIKITNKTIYVLSAPERYSIKTVFLQFDTYWSGKGCYKHGMKWEDRENKTKHYCGKRHPWIEYSDGSVVRLSVYGLQVYLDLFGFDFHIFYSICRICKVKGTRATTVIVYNLIHSVYMSAVSHTNSFWHIFCEPGNEVRVVVHYDVKDYINILDVYAGPGPKSTKMSPSDRHISTGNFMFLEKNVSVYENLFDTNISHAYIVNTGEDSNISFVFRYGTIYSVSVQNCRQALPYRTHQMTTPPLWINVTADGKHNVQCYFTFSTNLYAEVGERVYTSLEILHFKFQGPTIVSEYSDQPCHYGGLFFYSQYDHHLPPYSLCNAKGEYIPQIIALPSSDVYTVFQWFRGYSSGSLTAIFHVTQCAITNMSPPSDFVSWPGPLACQQFFFFWQNFIETIGSLYNLTITSASDTLLGPSLLSYSLIPPHSIMTEEISNKFHIIAQNFTTWPITTKTNALFINIKKKSRSNFIYFLANITVKILILEVKSTWHITLKVDRSVCNGIMKGEVSSKSILIAEGCTMDHVVARNETVTFIHAPLNNQLLTYITLEPEQGCEQIHVTKDEVIPARYIHRHVYTRFTNIKERVVFNHEISRSILTITFNVTSLTHENCTSVVRVTPNDLRDKQQTNTEAYASDNFRKQRWIFYNRRLDNLQLFHIPSSCCKHIYLTRIYK